VSTWLCHIANIQGASCTYLAHHELESVVVIVITAHQVEHHTLLIPSAVQSDEQHVKLVLGHSYIYTDGKLASVPASRAAVFRDRTLGPMDKRLLTRFLMQLGNSTQENPFPQVAHNCKYKLAAPSSEKSSDCTSSTSCLVQHLHVLLLWCCYTCNNLCLAQRFQDLMLWCCYT